MLTIVRTILPIINKNNFHACRGYLDEEVFMKQPPGFFNGVTEYSKLKKSLHGLK